MTARWPADRRTEVEAAIRAGAAEGLCWREVGERIGLKPATIAVYAHRLGVRSSHPPGRPPDSELRKAIREGYALGTRPRFIAMRTGASEGTVRVLAHKMGLTSRAGSWKQQWAREYRGYDIPPERHDEFLNLQRRGFKVHEIGRMFGLLPTEEGVKL